MNMLIWNCRGAGKRHFPRLIRDYAKMYNLSFLAILEPRISGARADNVVNKLGSMVLLSLTLLGLQVVSGVFGKEIGSPLTLSLRLNIAFC